MQKIKIGDRVQFFSNPEITGTITEIYLYEYPFYVKWDDGKDDWYKASQLRLLEGGDNATNREKKEGIGRS